MSTTELPRPAESLQEQLQRQRAEQQDTTIEKLPIPGVGGRLIGCYRLLDWKAQRRIAARNAKVRGKDKEDTEALQELYNAADTLIASCEQIEVRTPKDADEQTKTEAAKFNAEGHKLNVAFAEYLGRHKADEERILDRGAVFLIIPQQTQVVVHAGLLMKAQGTVDEEIDEEQLGESDAAS
jgi:hypothetical protein